MQFALLFSGAQLSLIIIIAVVFAALFAANSVLLVLFYYKRKKSKLCTAELQQRREQLLEELAQLRFFTPKEEQEEEPQVIEEVDDIDSGEEEEAEIELEAEELPSGEEIRTGDILAVCDMSALMRERFGFVGSEFDRKQYYVRYSYSFLSKLCASSDEVKDFYRRLSDEVGRYGSVKTRLSFRHERIYLGRKTLGVLAFRGKTLCIALALNPADYAGTKYRGSDVAHMKRFSATPMLVKITSARKLKYVIYLLSQLAELNSVARDNENYYGVYELQSKNLKELFALDLVRISILGEAPELDGDISADGDDNEVAASANSGTRLKILPVNEMSDLMRQKFGLYGARFDGKRYYVRYSYAFEAKLRSSSDDVKRRYEGFMQEVGLYKISLARTFRQQRLYSGRKTVGLIFFRGKTLCVALALNPNEFEETKYRGIDVSEIKRFKSTPMLVKITSARRLLYAKYLLNRVAEEYLIEMRPEPEKYDISLEESDMHGYFAEELLKISVIGEVPDDVPEE